MRRVDQGLEVLSDRLVRVAAYQSLAVDDSQFEIVRNITGNFADSPRHLGVKIAHIRQGSAPVNTRTSSNPPMYSAPSLNATGLPRAAGLCDAIAPGWTGRFAT